MEDFLKNAIGDIITGNLELVGDINKDKEDHRNKGELHGEDEEDNIEQEDEEEEEEYKNKEDVDTENKEYNEDGEEHGIEHEGYYNNKELDAEDKKDEEELKVEDKPDHNNEGALHKDDEENSKGEEKVKGKGRPNYWERVQDKKIKRKERNLELISQGKDPIFTSDEDEPIDDEDKDADFDPLSAQNQVESEEENDGSDEENERENEEASEKSEEDDNNTEDQQESINTEDEPAASSSRSTKKKWRPKMVQCVRCHKGLQSLGDTFRKHYRAKHKDIPVCQWEDEIADARARQPPKRSDTRDVRYKLCQCGDLMTYQNMIDRHMVIDHPARCATIDLMKISPEIKEDPVKRKKWSLAMINSFPNKSKTEKEKKPPVDQFYRSTSKVTVSQITEVVRKWNASMQGRLEVDIKVNKKKKRGERLTPEEYRVWYRPYSVQNHQKKVLQYIYGNDPFVLDDFHKIGDWLSSDEDTELFTSRTTGDGETHQLSYYYIANLARSMLHLIEYINQHYSDRKFLDVVAAVEKKIRAVERNATKKGDRMRKRSSIMKEKDQTIPIEELKKFAESSVHIQVIGRLLDNNFNATANEWPREVVYQTACHVAAELVLNTGKRPGVICGMRIKDILDAQEDIDAEGKKVMTVKIEPECPYGIFKTVTVSVMKLELPIYRLLKQLCRVRQESEEASDNDRVFTSSTNIPLRNLQEQFRKAWTECGCVGVFTPKIVRHTIVTQFHNAIAKNRMPKEELEALARAMDHSLRVAETVYRHEQHKLIADPSHKIKKLLLINEWQEEEQRQLEDEFNEELEDGIVLIDEEEMGITGKEKREESMQKQKERGGTGVGAKIGKNQQKWSNEETELFKKLFSKYIEKRVKHMGLPIRESEVVPIWNTQFKIAPRNSPYWKLKEKADSMRDVTEKVRTIVRSERGKARTALKKQMQESELFQRKAEMLEERKQEQMEKKKKKEKKRKIETSDGNEGTSKMTVIPGSKKQRKDRWGRFTWLDEGDISE